MTSHQVLPLMIRSKMLVKFLVCLTSAVSVAVTFITYVHCSCLYISVTHFSVLATEVNLMTKGSDSECVFIHCLYCLHCSINSGK